ncbi:hypothetical protein AOLI_G00299890 [Acnodon oligacanthus]
MPANRRGAGVACRNTGALEQPGLRVWLWPGVVAPLRASAQRSSARTEPGQAGNQTQREFSVLRRAKQSRIPAAGGRLPRAVSEPHRGVKGLVPVLLGLEFSLLPAVRSGYSSLSSLINLLSPPSEEWVEECLSSVKSFQRASQVKERERLSLRKLPETAPSP